MSTGREEAQEYVEIGALNGLFVLGRTVGFIGTSLPSPPLLLCLFLSSKYHVFVFSFHKSRRVEQAG